METFEIVPWLASVINVLFLLLYLSSIAKTAAAMEANVKKKIEDHYQGCSYISAVVMAFLRGAELCQDKASLLCRMTKRCGMCGVDC